MRRGWRAAYAPKKSPVSMLIVGPAVFPALASRISVHRLGKLSSLYTSVTDTIRSVTLPSSLLHGRASGLSGRPPHSAHPLLLSGCSRPKHTPEPSLPAPVVPEEASPWSQRAAAVVPDVSSERGGDWRRTTGWPLQTLLSRSHSQPRPRIRRYNITPATADTAAATPAAATSGHRTDAREAEVLCTTARSA